MNDFSFIAVWLLASLTVLVSVKVTIDSLMRPKEPKRLKDPDEP